MYISAFLTPRKTAIKKRLAGFLTYFVENDLPVFYRQWYEKCFLLYKKLTVAGTAPDSHRIPSL